MLTPCTQYSQLYLLIVTGAGFLQVILCMEKYLQKLPALVTLIIQGVTLLAGMVVFKIGLGKALQVTDDVSMVAIVYVHFHK